MFTNRYSVLLKKLKSGEANLPSKATLLVAKAAQSLRSFIILTSGLVVAVLLFLSLIILGHSRELVPMLIGSGCVLMIWAVLWIMFGLRIPSNEDLKMLDYACYLVKQQPLEEFALLPLTIQPKLSPNKLSSLAKRRMYLEAVYPCNEEHSNRIFAKEAFRDAYATFLCAGFIKDDGYGEYFGRKYPKK